MGRLNRHTILGLFTLLCSLLSVLSCSRPKDDKPSLFSCDEFTLYADSVVEGDFVAKVLHNGALSSNFNSLDTPAVPDVLRFRFCINAVDNEFEGNQWHYARISPSDSSDVYQFGYIGTADDTGSSSHSDMAGRNWTVRLDMKNVLRQFHDRGFFVTNSGDTVFKNDFRGVWLTGDRFPLFSDMAVLHSRSDMKLSDNGDSIYELTLHLPSSVKPVIKNRVKGCDSIPVSFPLYTSRIPIVDVNYNLAVNSVDSLLKRYGENTSELNIQAVSAAVYLSLAWMNAEASKALLRKCVSNSRVTQGISHGGTWPISNDRLIWVLAAYEVYRATGDRTWLEYVNKVSTLTIADIEEVQKNRHTGLVCGAPSSVVSFRRNYPEWCGAVDIYESQALYPNVLYARACRIMALISSEMNDLERFDYYNEKFKRSCHDINRLLWIPNLSRYSEYLYGAPYSLQSQSTDNLGQSFAALFDIATAEMASSVVRFNVQSCYGISRNFPVQTYSPTWSYEGNFSDPSLQMWWILAASKSVNAPAMRIAMAAFYRNVSFSLGKWSAVNVANGALISSDDKEDGTDLLSVSSVIAMNLRTLMGIQFGDSSITVNPFIPDEFSGDRHLSHFQYRKADLDLYIKGRGSKIHSAFIDGIPVNGIVVPDTLSGHHIIEVNMSQTGSERLAEPATMPEVLPPVPEILWEGKKARILNYTSGVNYLMIMNGVIQEELDDSDFSLYALPGFAMVQFLPLQSDRLVGYASKPRFFVPQGRVVDIPVSKLGACGTELPVPDGRDSLYLEMSPARNLHIGFNVRVSSDSKYLISFRYANGSGEEDTQSRCVIRTMSVNGKSIGAVIFPCTGEGNWCSFHYSNILEVPLKKGINRISLDFVSPFNLNGVHSPGTALIQSVRFIKL